MLAIDNDTINQWLEWKDGFHKDKEYFDYAIGVRGNQQNVIEEIRTFLNKFQDGSISLEEFRSTFHHKTSTDWDYFGMKGMNGAMVLNMYVKYVPDKTALSDHLREVLVCPNNAEEGQKKMEQLSSFLESMMKKYKLKRIAIQQGRIPYFVSGFWHFQSPEKWPFYYPLTRKIFEQNGIYKPQSHPVRDYFNFLKIYLDLKMVLEVDSFELDYLCGWIENRSSKQIADHPVYLSQQSDTPSLDVESESPDITHTHVQWMLAKIGKKMGYNIWIASNDRNREYQNQTLGSFSVPELPPLGLGETAQKTIQYIDVIWLKGTKHIVAAFEVERTTQIYSGLLRMSDLVVEAPNAIFPLYIIAPEIRQKDIEKQLLRPTFESLGLHERCGFFSDQALSDDFDNIMKFASDLSAIDTLATRIQIV